MRKILPYLFICVFALIATDAFAQKHVQDARLANHYFQQGEFEKALTIYQKIYKRDPNGAYTNYVKCLTGLERYSDAEKLIKKHMKKRPNVPKLTVDLGVLYEEMGDRERAEKQYEKAIKMLKPNMQTVNALAKNFINMQEYDYAIETYHTGRRLLNGSYPFHFELAEA
ncbi:MAG: tetratricopeptide repeat protein, partial [Bacteroidia bacterium]|nr:tetratricopeptide repeat protein [Bacteroidia bacterium]